MESQMLLSAIDNLRAALEHMTCRADAVEAGLGVINKELQNQTSRIETLADAMHGAQDSQDLGEFAAKIERDMQDTLHSLVAEIKVELQTSLQQFCCMPLYCQQVQPTQTKDAMCEVYVTSCSSDNEGEDNIYDSTTVPEIRISDTELCSGFDNASNGSVPSTSPGGSSSPGGSLSSGGSLSPGGRSSPRGSTTCGGNDVWDGSTDAPPLSDCCLLVGQAQGESSEVSSKSWEHSSRLAGTTIASVSSEAWEHFSRLPIAALSDMRRLMDGLRNPAWSCGIQSGLPLGAVMGAQSFSIGGDGVFMPRSSRVRCAVSQWENMRRHRPGRAHSIPVLRTGASPWPFAVSET